MNRRDLLKMGLALSAAGIDPGQTASASTEDEVLGLFLRRGSGGLESMRMFEVRLTRGGEVEMVELGMEQQG